MKRLFPWWYGLLILCPYIALAANLFLLREGLAAWLLGWLGVTLLVSAANLDGAMRQTDSHIAAKMGMLVKLLHIPAYVMALMMAPLLIAAPPVLLALLATNVCMLLTTSAYTLRGLYLSWRGGWLANGRAAILAASQLVFVLDVVGSILLYILEKRRSR